MYLPHISRFPTFLSTLGVARRRSPKMHTISTSKTILSTHVSVGYHLIFLLATVGQIEPLFGSIPIQALVVSSSSIYVSLLKDLDSEFGLNHNSEY